MGWLSKHRGTIARGALIAVNAVLLMRLAGAATDRYLTISEEALPANYQLSAGAKAHLTDAFGQGWKALFLVFASGEKRETLESLTSQVTAAGPNRIAVGVVSGALPAGLRAPQFRRLDDDRATLHRELHISDSHGHGGLVVINSEFEVDFRSIPIPSQDTFRQLIEKYAGGEINYMPADSRVDTTFLRGAPLPDVFVRELSNGAELSLRKAAQKANTLVVFGAPCSTCQLGGYLTELRALMTAAPESTIVLLADGFDVRMLEQLQRQGDLPQSAYSFSRAALTASEDVNATRFRPEALRPTVVALAADGTIRGTLPLRLPRVP